MISDLVHRKTYFLKELLDWHKYDLIIELNHSKHFVFKNIVFKQVGRYKFKFSILTECPIQSGDILYPKQNKTKIIIFIVK